MAGDRWTFLVVRGQESPVRQYSLSPRALALGGAGVGLILVVLLVLALGVGFGGATRIEARQLRTRNEALTAELDRIQNQVTQLEENLDGLTERDTELRSVAGLDPIDDEILRVGIGGPGADTPESHPLWPVDSVMGKAAFAAQYDLNALERRARLLEASMDEAGDSLRAHRDLLLSTPSIMPTTGYLSSRFSRSRNHPIYHEALPHEGIDIAAPRGTPILAAAKGRVVRAGWVTGYGQMVEIDHGYGYTTRYGHASKILVRVGQQVQRGDIIAQVGSTGIATSANLHYEVRVNGRPQNPMNYVLPAVVP